MYAVKKAKAQGFTIIELLLVIAIIGILTSIITASVGGARSSGRDAKRVSDLKSIQTSIALYYNDHGHYPCSLSGTFATGPCAPSFGGSSGGVYLTKIPTDPQNGSDYIYSAQSADLSTDNTTCGGGNRVVSYYHLGAVMEQTASSLMSQDEDKTLAQQTGYACSQSGGTRFDGNAASCVGSSAAGSDNCYDVTPY